MKNDYTRDSFWTSEDENGNKQYYIKINGMLIPVSEDVYKVCKYSYVKTLRDSKRDAEKLLSLDRDDSNGLNLYEQLAVKNEQENDNQEVLYILKELINELNEKQKIALMKYYFDGKSVYEIAEEMNVQASAISKRLKRGIKKLKKFYENGHK